MSELIYALDGVVVTDTRAYKHILTFRHHIDAEQLVVDAELLVVDAELLVVDAELLARGQYSEGSATGHLDTGFSWFPCVYKQMLRWPPRFQVATTCFSCSPPDLNLNLSLTSFIFCLHVK